MKLTTWLIVPILISGSAYSKIDRHKIRECYNAINAAELNVIQKNYKDALKHHKEAFTFKYPNGKDSL